MTPKRAAARKPQPAADPSLPEVLIPPSKARDEQRDAYWLDLLQEPAQFKDAIQTEEFFPMLKDFPEALWGDRLTLYLYRLPDDEGVMVKNAEGERKHIMVARFPMDEEWVKQKFGGGKYQGWLKLDSKETLRKHTFRIDGPPKVQPGQVVLVDDKPVSIGASPVTAAPESRSDVATIIDANSKAEEKRMEMLLGANKASIELVKEQATSATQKDPLTTAIELVKLLQPQQPAKDPMAAALEIVDHLDAMAARRNPPPPEREERETPLSETLATVKELTGAESIADLLKPRHRPAESESYGWVAPVVGAVQHFIGQLPAIMQEARISREMEFRRQVWLRTAKNGEAPPPELLASNPGPVRPASATTSTPVAQAAVVTSPTQPAAPAKMDIGTLANLIVQTICHGFDSNPRLGYQTAATIDVLYGRQIEDFGLDQFIADEKALTEYVRGIPQLAERSRLASWGMFQAEFLEYTRERWGSEADEGEEEQPLAMVPTGPAPKKPNSSSEQPPAA